MTDIDAGGGGGGDAGMAAGCGATDDTSLPPEHPAKVAQTISMLARDLNSDGLAWGCTTEAFVWDFISFMSNL
ncbi:MAG: hypothetical protein AAFQ24_08630 [Pseudomonadota bacterium]